MENLDYLFLMLLGTTAASAGVSAVFLAKKLGPPPLGFSYLANCYSLVLLLGLLMTILHISIPVYVWFALQIGVSCISMLRGGSKSFSQAFFGAVLVSTISFSAMSWLQGLSLMIWVSLTGLFVGGGVGILTTKQCLDTRVDRDVEKNK